MELLNFKCISILSLCLLLSSAERDFQFENISNDGIQQQITLTEAPLEHIKPVYYKSTYTKEMSQCPSTESQIILSLVLKSHRWNNISENKRNRAISKLSNFFAVPKEYLQPSSVSSQEIDTMIKRSIKHSMEKIMKKHVLGKIDLMIGCGNRYFTIAEPISKQIDHQIKEGFINDLTDLEFGWWFIWEKKVSNRVQRYKREPAAGSGDGERDDYFEYDYDEEDEDEDEMDNITELPSVTTHAHRHHHGISKPHYTDIGNKKTETDKQSTDTNIIDGNNKKHKKNEFKTSIIIDDTEKKKSKRINVDEDIAKSVSKLESDITKTIENTNHFKDIGLETISNEKNIDKTDINLPSLITNVPVTKMDFNISKSYDDYVIEDFVTEIIPETTSIVPVIAATTLIPKVDSTFTKETTTEFSQSTTKAIILDHTTQQSIVSTTLSAIKKPFDESTIVSYTDEIITNIENRIINPFSASSTEITSTIIESTDITTLASIITQKKSDEVDDSSKKPDTQDQTTAIKKITSTLSTSVVDSDDIISASDDEIPEATTILAEIDSFSHNIETTSVATTTNSRLPSTSQDIELSSPITTTTTQVPTTSTRKSTKTSTTSIPTTTEQIELELFNNPPIIKNRLPKQPVTAGKPFSLTVPLETFFDNEDGTNLRLDLFDKNGNELKGNSWIQFDTEKREIYGLPLEDAVSRWQYKLVATDSKNITVTDTIDISVQQHKGHRSVNHEISLQVKLNKKFQRNIDWQIRLIRGIIETLNDDSMSSVVVREIRQSQQDPYTATFIYTNETIPKDKCPEDKLDELVKRLDYRKLTDSLLPELSVKSVSGQSVGPCIKPHLPRPKPTPHLTKNYPPVPRNQVDRVNATIGHLLVYKVPSDTFYDPEDTTDLKLSLLTIERSPIKPTHWLQFDSKNQEFFGIPKGGDYGSEEYLLVAEDHEGLTAADALVVVVNHPPKREYSVLFKVTLGIRYDVFNNAFMQRKFVEKLTLIFGDTFPSNIQIRSIQHLPDGESIMISFYNTTLLKTHHRCPAEDIEMIRNIWFYQDSILRDHVKNMLGTEFNIIGVTINPLGNCNAINGDISNDRIPIKHHDRSTSSSSPFKDDYLLTFILPAILIMVMVLLASIIACVLHRRRLTGKMELGDEEERRSFRSKGIPVIFQDELDEKPEIGNKSPIILKDEKPPLLPPSYNSTNLDGDNDVDEYVPPPAVIMGGREVRGKSPVTPSYRKPPPYVSP